MYLPLICRNIRKIRINVPKYLNTAATNEYIPVYKNPYIRVAGIINRLKFYQTISTVVAIPSSFIFCCLGTVSVDTFIVTTVFGITAMCSFFIFGIIPNKLVGFLYVSNDKKTAKIAYVDFWGKRKDIEIPISDLVPFADLPAIPTDYLYVTMRRYSTPQTFKIFLRHGIILDNDKFKTAFLQ